MLFLYDMSLLFEAPMSEFKKTAIGAALKAGDILKNGFGKSFGITSKEGRNNLVTEFDLLSENCIISEITARYPGHSILAEESGSRMTGSEFTWVIDPLDGTVNFANGLPVFSISIGLMKDNEIIAGIIYNPLLDEMFSSEKNGGAFLNGKNISVSHNGDILRSLLVTGFSYNIDKNIDAVIAPFRKIVGDGIPVRRLGSAALDLAYVACGRFDGFWEEDLKPWDVCAGTLLVNEAGGRVTCFEDDSCAVDDKTILATNGKIHENLRHYLS